MLIFIELEVICLLYTSTIVWVGIPMLFMIVDWVYKHVFNIEYLELSILLFVVATIYKTYQK